MKVVRISCFYALLLAFAVQLSLAQSNASSDQQPTPPPQNQQQVQEKSPLTDQASGIAAEQKVQQDQQKSGQLTQFETPGGTQQDQALGEIRLMSRYSEIGGDKTRSFRDPGMNNLAEFNYFMDRRFMVTHRVQTLSMFRATDDYSIDPEKDSIQKAFVRIYGPRDEYIFGDALVNYSRLTFNQNVKGVSTSWLLGKKWKLSLVGGVFIDRWGSFYKDLQGRPYVSRVEGARLAYSFTRDFTVGLNFSASDDLLGSLPFAEFGTSPMPASNRVGSVDMKYQRRNLRIDGEMAYSVSDFDTRASDAPCSTDVNGVITLGPCDTRLPQPNVGYQGDWGGRIEASYKYQRFNLRASAVRFQPNFASINARQIADLEDILVRPGFDVTAWLSVDGTMRYSANDLKSQLPYQTTLWGPEGRFIFHDLPFYRRAVLEMGYRDRIVNSSDNISVDRFVRGPYAEVTVPVSTTFLTVGYERRNAIDHITPGQSSNTNRFYAGIRGVYDVGGWHINPSARWELERQSSRPDLDLTPPDPRFDLDSNRLDTINLIIEPPKYFILEGGFRDATATIFGPSGYSRPAYRAQITYKFRNDENVLLVFSFERNNNYYFTSPNFDERISGVSFIYKFGKRGR